MVQVITVFVNNPQICSVKVLARTRVCLWFRSLIPGTNFSRSSLIWIIMDLSEYIPVWDNYNHNHLVLLGLSAICIIVHANVLCRLPYQNAQFIVFDGLKIFYFGNWLIYSYMVYPWLENYVLWEHQYDQQRLTGVWTFTHYLWYSASNTPF